MLKEEWRLHSTLFGSVSFALFPVFIFTISCMSSLLLPLIREELPIGTVLSVTVALFVVMGMMIGGFGLLGKEVMNRRIGHASLLSHSARTLPLTERFIFLNFVVKDIVYYFFLWVLPFGAGFIIASPFVGVPLSVSLLLLLSTTLSFLTGLSAIFLLSVIYTRSRWVLGIILIVGSAGLLSAWMVTGVNPLLSFPALLVFNSFSPFVLTLALLVILIPCFLAFGFLVTDYHETERHYPDLFRPVSRYLSLFPFPALTTKDMLELYRSGTGIGQTLFSFLLPLGIIWFFLSLLPSLFWEGELIMAFALITGIFSATIFTWITEFDSYSSYTCLPIGVEQLIVSKTSTYAVLQIIPVIFLTIITLVTGNTRYLPLVLMVWVSFSFYCLSLTIYLMGLNPGALLYDAKVFLTYLVLTGFPALIFGGAAILHEAFLLGAPLLLLPAWVLILKGRAKWGKQEYSGF
jgi:hypothetical protein